MKTVREVMPVEVITISPDSTIRTAVALLKSNAVGALPVVDGGAPVGLLRCQDVLGLDPDEPVSGAMQRDFVSVEPGLPVHQAAEVMAKEGVTRLLVVENGALAGILTHRDVLPLLGRAYDPLTGLHWSDALRDWAGDRMARGEEVCIVFFDIDLFRRFNKKYGHVTGDRVLKAVTGVFAGVTDESRDVLCRMGGDEFVIGSIRPRDEVAALAQEASRHILDIRIEGVSEGISANFGIAGGQRTRERQDVHHAATIDDLLNRASLECTQMKRQKRGRLPEDEE